MVVTLAKRESRPHMTEAPDAESPAEVRSWECGVCGFEAHDEAPPDPCPNCGAESREFQRVAPSH